jgi:hypothetical protein
MSGNPQANQASRAVVRAQSSPLPAREVGTAVINRTLQPSRTVVSAWHLLAAGTKLPAAMDSIHGDRPEIVTNNGQLKPAGGEQAANALQRDGSTRYTTTANAKVRDAIEALPLVPK